MPKWFEFRTATPAMPWLRARSIPRVHGPGGEDLTDAVVPVEHDQRGRSRSTTLGLGSPRSIAPLRSRATYQGSRSMPVRRVAPQLGRAPGCRPAAGRPTYGTPTAPRMPTPSETRSWGATVYVAITTPPPTMLMTLRCAVLDDYQDVALTMADWTGSPAGRRAVFRSISTTRTRWPARWPTSTSSWSCASGRRSGVVVRPAPRLRLLITSGMRNARSTSPPLRPAWWCAARPAARSPAHRADLGADPGRWPGTSLPENAAFHAGGPWQSTVGIDLAGQPLGLLGLGKIGTGWPRRRGVRHGRRRVEPEPDPGAADAAASRWPSLAELLRAPATSCRCTSC